MEELIIVEEDRFFTPGRVFAAAALTAGIGLAVWSAIHGAKKPQVRARARQMADAAKRVYAHPDRLARGNGKTIGVKFFETVATTAAKTLASRLALALFQTALLGPSQEVEVLDFPVERIEPLPA